MTTPDKKSHWASLASTLGAKTPGGANTRTAAAAPKTPAAAAPPPAPVAEPAPVPTPEPIAAAPVAAAAKPVAPTKPAAKRDNWGRVLGALGLRAPEPEPEVEVEPVAVAPPPPPPPAVVAPIAPPAPVAAALPKNLWELLGDSPPAPVVEERVAAFEIHDEVGGNDLSLGEDDDSEEAEAPPAPAWRRPRGNEPAARSTADVERAPRREEEPAGDRPRRRRRRRRRGEAGVESTEERLPKSQVSAPAYERGEGDDDEVADHFDVPVDSYDNDELEGEPTVSEEKTGEEEPRRKRRRRRRGRGRGREQAPAEAVAAGPAHDADYVDDEDDEDDVIEAVKPAPPRREPNRGPAPAPRQRRAEAPVSREVDHHDDDDEEEEDDEDHAMDHAEHRGIPTWQDAMAIVVGTNMEARAKNPAGARGGRGRGGRGRGGRNR
ncbi:MAG TPA: hypothetical protein VL096_14670 [Pirellulaceae bacterium]|nr:hypothetical protein [Pirellulaceae bacterium]